MLVKFLRAVYCPSYNGPGDVREMDDMRAIKLMAEFPGALERYDPQAELRAKDESAQLPLVAPRPATQAPPRMASNLRRG